MKKGNAAKGAAGLGAGLITLGAVGGYALYNSLYTGNKMHIVQ
jgi:hypothetical protein